MTRRGANNRAPAHNTRTGRCPCTQSDPHAHSPCDTFQSSQPTSTLPVCTCTCSPPLSASNCLSTHAATVGTHDRSHVKRTASDYGLQATHPRNAHAYAAHQGFTDSIKRRNHGAPPINRPFMQSEQHAPRGEARHAAAAPTDQASRAVTQIATSHQIYAHAASERTTAIRHALAAPQV